MFEPFPGNYVWNLSINLALAQGAAIGEIDEVCRPLIGAEPDSEQLFASLCAVADRVRRQADADVTAGHKLSAATRYRRASIYYLTAERMQSRSFEPWTVAYRNGLDCFRRSVELGGDRCEFVEVPYRDGDIDTTLPGLLLPADGDGPTPYMVQFNGLDSTKEMVYGTGLAQQYRKRGISTLIIDQPGTGEPLRLHGMTGIAEAERYGSACVDYLAERSDCDAERIGVGGWSLGGYFAPRAAAFEPRFSLCAAWGAIYDWGELQRTRRERQRTGTAEPSVAHFWEHVMWVFGKKSVDEFVDFAASLTMAEVSAKIEVPLLVVHGGNDRQVSPAMAQKQYDAAVNSPNRQLKIMTLDDGGFEHCAADNMPATVDFIADWVADRFGTGR